MGIGSYDSVAPGEPFKPSSRVWNEFVEAARRSSQGKFGETGAGLSAAWGFPCNVVRFRNDSGLALGPHQPVSPAPAGAIGPLTTEPLVFARYPVFSGDVIINSTQVPWITLEYIPIDGIGRVAVSGVTVANVNFSSTLHQYAVGAFYGLLNSTASPGFPTVSVRVLTTPPGTGSHLVPVLLHSWRLG